MIFALITLYFPILSTARCFFGCIFSAHRYITKLFPKYGFRCSKRRRDHRKKLTDNFDGLFCIVNKLSPVHLKLCTLDNCMVSVPVHTNRLKPFYDPAAHPIDPLPPTDDSPPDLLESDLPSDLESDLLSH